MFSCSDLWPQESIVGAIHAVEGSDRTPQELGHYDDYHDRHPRNGSAFNDKQGLMTNLQTRFVIKRIVALLSRRRPTTRTEVRTRVRTDQIERRATGARVGPASPPDAEPEPDRDLSTARRSPPPGQSLMAQSHEAATLKRPR
jgi:hypothetical protein